MEGRRGYWRQHQNPAPTRTLLWCAAHRWPIRITLGGVVALMVGVLVWAAFEDMSLVSPIGNVVVFAVQFVLWGFLFPRQVDQWTARQGIDPAVEAAASRHHAV